MVVVVAAWSVFVSAVDVVVVVVVVMVSCALLAPWFCVTVESSIALGC